MTRDTARRVSLEFTKSPGSICLARVSMYLRIATFTYMGMHKEREQSAGHRQAIRTFQKQLGNSCCCFFFFTNTKWKSINSKRKVIHTTTYLSEVQVYDNVAFFPHKADFINFITRLWRIADTLLVIRLDTSTLVCLQSL